MKYENHIDGFRAISILLVMCNHMAGAPPFLNGGIGVDIFFAISGFLITNILLIEFDEFGDISLRAFFMKRVFRIFPLYYTTIVIYIIASFVLYKLTRDSSKISDLFEAFPYLVTVNEEFMFNDKNTLFRAGMVGGNWRKVLSDLASTVFIFQHETKVDILCNSRCDNHIYYLYRTERLDGARLFASVF